MDLRSRVDTAPGGPAPIPGAGEALDRPRVLVVDDDERNLLAISTVLEDLGDIVTANSGEEALRHLLKDDFAVILLDVYMPGMDGYETAEIIRGRDQTKRIPIVFLSAVNKEPQHLLRGYAMGAVDYVFKPVEPVVLRSKVAVFVDLFTMTREIRRKAEHEQKLLDDNLRANAARLRMEKELRLAEQQLFQARKMDAIGKLTGGIAHDFNNLLAAVLGGLGLIERRLPLEEDHRKIVAMTRRAAEQGSDLVGRLLAFARRQQLQPAGIDPAALSTAVTDLLAHTLGGLVRLDWHSDDGVRCAYADGTQLELALVNLIINARDAMPQGGTITVTARNAAAPTEDGLDLQPGDYIVFAVADTGSGIPSDIIEQVTEPFFTTKGVGEGTGLGLSMVYGFARQSGGTMEIRSAVGEGTTVEIWLPAAPADILAAEQDPKREDAEPCRAPPMRILLVDDHDQVREATAAMLADLGHSVEAVGDGPAMLERLSGDPRAFDLIVTDYAMPLMSGLDLLERARRIRADIPALVISGYPSESSGCASFAGSGVLAKPFTLEQLGSAIAASVRETRPSPEPVRPALAGD